jgi:hypothetical protein
MQTYLLPLPASPETGEEQQPLRELFFLHFIEKKFCSFSHSENSVLYFLRAFSALRDMIFCVFAFSREKNSVILRFAGKKNGINANTFYYLSLPLLKQERS